jgi:uncharacterized protein (UPF0335 family)
MAKKHSLAVSFDVERLTSLVERIEQLQNDRRELGADITAVFKEAEGAGFDKRAMRVLIAERRAPDGDRDSLVQRVAEYRQAIAGLGGTPLGDVLDSSGDDDATGDDAAPPLRAAAAKIDNVSKLAGRKRKAKDAAEGVH